MTRSRAIAKKNVSAPVLAGPQAIDRAAGDAADLVRSLIATGGDPVQAWKMAAKSFGVDAAARDAFAIMLRDTPGKDAIRLFDVIAGKDPALANNLLTEAIRSGALKPWLTHGDFPGYAIGARPWVTSLPSGIDIDGSLSLKGAKGLQTLPDNTWAIGLIDLDGCEALTSIGKGLRAESLYLCGSPKLTHVADNPRIRNFFGVIGCDSLRALPKGLNLKSLRVTDCPNLTSLPDDLVLRPGGTLEMRKVPAWDGKLPKGVTDNLEPRKIEINEA